MVTSTHLNAMSLISKRPTLHYKRLELNINYNLVPPNPGVPKSMVNFTLYICFIQLIEYKCINLIASFLLVNKCCFYIYINKCLVLLLYCFCIESLLLLFEISNSFIKKAVQNCIIYIITKINQRTHFLQKMQQVL